MSNEISRKTLLKQNVDNFLMRTEITCSMLESTSTSDNDEMNTYVYRLPCLEPEINYLMK